MYWWLPCLPANLGNSNMKIRYFQNGDLSQCVRLFMMAFRQSPWNEKWDYQDAQDYLLDAVNTPGFVGLVVCKDESIVGMLFGRKRKWWDGYEFHIDEMCVAPEKQGLGIGTHLLSYVMDNILDVDMRRVKLWTHVDAIAHEFYKKYGFEDISSFVFMVKNNL